MTSRTRWNVFLLMSAFGPGVGLSPSAVRADPPVFSGAVYYWQRIYGGFGLGAGAPVAADFNGDGKMDIAVPGTYVAGIDVFLNNGSGGATQTWFAAGRSPAGLAAGDFDGDGHMDLAVALQDEGGVAILTNDGTGAFTRTAFYATGLAPATVVAVDLDKDGRLELVVANRGDGTITVLGNSGGAFAVRQTIPLPLAVDAAPASVSCEPTALVAADLNSDTWPDVAVACAADDTVKVLTNIGGTLSLSGTYPAGPYPAGIVAADFNRDGQMDLAAADREAPQVTVLLANPITGYQPQDVFLVAVPYGAFSAPVGIAAVDVNADGKVDLLAGGVTLQNDGTAGFTITQAQPTWQDVVYSSGMLSGNAGTFVSTYFFFPGTGLGTVSLGYYGPAVPGIPGQTNVADMNADGQVGVGDLQILVASWGKRQGQDGYDARADINADHAVNIGDLQILVSNWGRSQ